MHYKMIGTLERPATKYDVTDAETIAIDINFDVNFCHRNDYRNGYYVTITDKNIKDNEPLYFDLRYDTSFNKENAEKWLKNWAKRYWGGVNTYTGQDGWWKVAKLEIFKIQ